MFTRDGRAFVEGMIAAFLIAGVAACLGLPSDLREFGARCLVVAAIQACGLVVFAFVRDE